MGINWSDEKPLEQQYLRDIPVSGGLYKLLDNNMELLYIGKSKKLRTRLLDHSRKHWNDIVPFFSFVSFRKILFHISLKSWETI